MWLPWQRTAFEVAGEMLPSGRYAYNIVVVTVPRQCGKTASVHDTAIGRLLAHQDYRAAYAAQTGHITTERFVERFGELEAGPLAARLKLRRSQGTERITHPSTGSHVRAFPPKDGALRSSANDLVIVDEAQEHDEALGRALDTTIMPTFSTRPRRQLVIIGTAGTDESQYLARYRQLALEYLERQLAGDVDPDAAGIAIVEYGALEGEDTDDEAVWLRRHPGLAGGLTDLDALRSARTALGRAGFAREYLNIWTRTAVTVVTPEKLAAARAVGDMPDGRICLAVDVSVDRSAAAIAACGPEGINAAGNRGRYLELIDARPGVDWVTERVTELARRWGAPVVADRVGPTGTVHDELTRRDEVELITPTAQDVANACADILDDLEAEHAVIRPHPDLDAAFAGAALRNLGEGKAWSRRGASGNIAPLVAVTNAAWGYSRLPAPPKKPAVSGGR